MENPKTMNQTSIFSKKDTHEQLSILSLMFISSNLEIREEFIKYAKEQYENELKSYFEILGNYLAGDSSVFPPPMFVKR